MTGLKKYTVAEYLDFERASEARHEYFAGHVTAMAGASENHNLVAHSGARAFSIALDDTPCRVYQSDMRVRTRTTLYTYPDIVVACGKREFEGDRRDILINPLLVAEVLSESTEGYDRGTKFEHYRSVASLRTYLLIAQDRIYIEFFERQPSGDWLLKADDAATALMPLPALNVSVVISDFYKKVEFPPPGKPTEDQLLAGGRLGSFDSLT